MIYCSDERLKYRTVNDDEEWSEEGGLNKNGKEIDQRGIIAKYTLRSEQEILQYN